MTEYLVYRWTVLLFRFKEDNEDGAGHCKGWWGRFLLAAWG